MSENNEKLVINGKEFDLSNTGRALAVYEATLKQMSKGDYSKSQLENMAKLALEYVEDSIMTNNYKKK